MATVPSFTLADVQTALGVQSVPANAGDASWMDKIFDKLISAGSTYLDFELQSKALENQARLQAQYGALYSSPGTLFPVTGQVGAVTGNSQMVTIVGVVAVMGLGIYLLNKA